MGLSSKNKYLCTVIVTRKTLAFNENGNRVHGHSVIENKMKQSSVFVIIIQNPLYDVIVDIFYEL